MPKKSTDKAKEIKETAMETAAKAAEETKKTAKAVAKGTKNTAKVVAEETKKAAKVVAKETKKMADKATTAKAEIVSEIYIQYAGNEVTEKTIIEKAKAAYSEAGHRPSSIKTFQMYVKPEENAAYYVINKNFTGKIDLF